MAESAYIAGRAVQDSHRLASPRFSALVRITHWIATFSFFGLLVSGVAIFLAHPRLYWGETGGVGARYIIAFPLPFMKGGPSGWGRSLHFLSAWVCILTWLLYLLSGIFTQHFRKHLLPAKGDLTWNSIARPACLARTWQPANIYTGLIREELRTTWRRGIECVVRVRHGGIKETENRSRCPSRWCERTNRSHV